MQALHLYLLKKTRLTNDKASKVMFTLKLLKINILKYPLNEAQSSFNSLCSCCSPLLLQISASLVWGIYMTIYVMQNVLSNSGELRLQRYLKNVDNMGWVLV